MTNTQKAEIIYDSDMMGFVVGWQKADGNVWMNMIDPLYRLHYATYMAAKCSALAREMFKDA